MKNIVVALLSAALSIGAVAAREGSGLDVVSNNYSAAEVAADTRLHPNAAGHRLFANWIKAEAAAAGYF